MPGNSTESAMCTSAVVESAMRKWLNGAYRKEFRGMISGEGNTLIYSICCSPVELQTDSVVQRIRFIRPLAPTSQNTGRFSQARIVHGPLEKEAITDEVS